jgi:hypothetical protein
MPRVAFSLPLASCYTCSGVLASKTPSGYSIAIVGSIEFVLALDGILTGRKIILWCLLMLMVSIILYAWATS